VKQQVSITINSRRYVAEVPLRTLLVDFIREHAGLTGTHVGCGHEGRCGACTIVLNGEAVKSCLVLAVQADGGEVLTIEGLEGLSGEDGGLHPIQDAFWERHGLQCGYCTPGMLMTTLDVLASREDGEPEMTDDDVRHCLVGNICRCTGYSHIVEAVRLAAGRMDAMPAERRRSCLSAQRSQEARP
jgi:carbon-monoxide dehydrogenase small subunit